MNGWSGHIATIERRCNNRMRHTIRHEKYRPAAMLACIVLRAAKKGVRLFP